MRTIQCSAVQRRRLQRQLHRTHDARVHRRTLALLEVAQGRPAPQVARLLRVDPSSVRRWMDRYQQQDDPDGLADRPRCGRQRLWSDDDLHTLDALLECDPQDWGYAASQWTVPLLHKHLPQAGLPACSGRTLRRRMEELDRVWKRPRYVLAADPEKEKKTPHSPAADARN